MSRLADNFKEHWNWVFISSISKYFFQELEAFQTSYLSIINYLQPFVYIFQFLISVSFISVNATMSCNISNMAPVIVFHY